MTKKKVIIILLIIALALPLGITFSKYAYTFVSNYLMEANNFFFIIVIESSEVVLGK